MNHDEFKAKVQAMTGKQIVQAMIDGLKREWVKVDMETFVSTVGEVCFGCAATNAVCQINGAALTRQTIHLPLEGFAFGFERAISYLRHGNRVFIYG